VCRHDAYYFVQFHITAPHAGARGRRGSGSGNALESCPGPSLAITHTWRGHYASLKGPDRAHYVHGGPPPGVPRGGGGPVRLARIAERSNVIFDRHGGEWGCADRKLTASLTAN